MKIGVFDSGVGGLIILKSIVRHLPQYDYVYLGDTKRVPYGQRSQAEIYQWTKQAMEFLFTNDCALVIVACNTASSRALRKIQREWLPYHYPDRRVLGVIIPTVEAIPRKAARVGVLATKATVASNAYKKELRKINSKVLVYQKAAPSLVMLIEQGNRSALPTGLKNYLSPLLKKRVSHIILGCTHYPLVKNLAASFAGKRVKVVSQDEIIPSKVDNYLKRHPEIRKRLSQKRSRSLLVTKKTPTTQSLAMKWFGKSARLQLVKVK